MNAFNFSLSEYLKEMEFLVNTDCGSLNPEGVEKIADYFVEKFNQIGWKTKKHHTSNEVGPCLEIKNTDKDEFDVLLIGHMDTVFKKGAAAERPLSIKGNRAYGPGVYDMKASLLSAYYALKFLTESGALKNTAIALLFNSDEEISSRYSRPLIKEMAKKSRCALVLEPARADGSMVNTRRGVGRYTVEFTGLASHSGIAPEKGISAINELAHWVIALHSLNDYKKGTSVNVGVIKGGTTANTVAANAVAEFDLRIKDLSEAEKVENTIKHLLDNPKTPGIKVNVNGGVTRPPMNPTAETMKICNAVDEIAKQIGVEFEWIPTGGASDANLTAALGVPTIDGVGPVGGLSHTVDEYLEIDSVEPRAKLLYGLLKHLAK